MCRIEPCKPRHWRNFYKSVTTHDTILTVKLPIEASMLAHLVDACKAHAAERFPGHVLVIHMPPTADGLMEFQAAPAPARHPGVL